MVASAAIVAGCNILMPEANHRRYNSVMMMIVGMMTIQVKMMALISLLG